VDVVHGIGLMRPLLLLALALNMEKIQEKMIFCFSKPETSTAEILVVPVASADQVVMQ
jgi:hypothetical protein